MFWELVKNFLQLHSKPVFVVLTVLFGTFFALRIRSYTETEISKTISASWLLLRKKKSQMIYRKVKIQNKQTGGLRNNKKIVIE